MAITISYDLTNIDSNDRTYIRSMFERFGWKRVGGSVFRYSRINEEEDWLNEVVPALMIFRSFVVAKNITINFFTLDTNSVAHIDWSDDEQLLGDTPNDGNNLNLHQPTNNQSSETRIRRAVTLMADLFNAGDDDS